MYSTQETAVKIKEIAKQKNITIKKMLSDCELNINYISGMANGKRPTMKNLEKIALYLNVTPDELLGVTSTEKSISPQDEMLLELIKRFQRLSFNDKLDVFNYINAK